MAKGPYIAITLFEFTSDAPDHVPLYREDVTLLYAESDAEARELAEERFRNDEGTYKNAAGDNITVTPTAVIDVVAALIDDLSEGGDLYSRHFRDFDAYSKWETLLSDRPHPITGDPALRASHRRPGSQQIAGPDLDPGTETAADLGESSP